VAVSDVDVRPCLAVVTGVRPHYLKLVPLQRAAHGSGAVRWWYVDAGQHYDRAMAEQYHREYGLRFDRSLRCGRPGDRPLEVLARMLVACHDCLAAAAPDAVVVLGDTNTTYAAARAAHELGIPIAHLEAGVRSRTRRIEDVNRHAVDDMAGLHVASSRSDLQALTERGLAATSRFAGDLMADLCAEAVTTVPGPGDGADGAGPDGSDRTAPDRPQDAFAVVALHHPQSLTGPATLRRVIAAVDALGLAGVLVQHPRTRQVMAQGRVEVPSTWIVRDALPHRDLLRLVRAAAVTVTDSGGLQRECAYVGRRAVVVQEHPFWPWLVDAGVNVAVAPDGDVAAAVKSALGPWIGTVDEFGTPGTVAGTTVRLLEEWVLDGCP